MWSLICYHFLYRYLIRFEPFKNNNTVLLKFPLHRIIWTVILRLILKSENKRLQNASLLVVTGDLIVIIDGTWSLWPITLNVILRQMTPPIKYLFIYFVWKINPKTIVSHLISKESKDRLWLMLKLFNWSC